MLKHTFRICIGALLTLDLAARLFSTQKARKKRVGDGWAIWARCG